MGCYPSVASGIWMHDLEPLMQRMAERKREDTSLPVHNGTVWLVPFIYQQNA